MESFRPRRRRSPPPRRKRGQAQSGRSNWLRCSSLLRLHPPSVPLVNANAGFATSNSSGVGTSMWKLTLSRSKSQSFATKRRPATKLTEFFGAEYPNLYQAMLTTTTTTTTSTAASTDVAMSTSSLRTEVAKEPTEKNPLHCHYHKASATRTRKSSDAVLPSRGELPPSPPPAFKKRKSVVAPGLTSSDSSSLRVGVDDSCRWSAKGPEEVEDLMTKLRAVKA